MRISKLLNVLVLLTFLLPFFYTGCSPSAEEISEKAKMDSIRIADSLSQLPNYVDTSLQTINVEELKSVDFSQNFTIVCDTILNNQEEVKISSSKSEKDKSFSDKIIEKYAFLKPILIPKTSTYTGLGVVVNLLEFFGFISLFLSFIILFINFLIKYIDKKSIRTIVLLDVFILLGIYFSTGFCLWGCQELWGYWVSVTFASILLIFDLYVLVLEKNK